MKDEDGLEVRNGIYVDSKETHYYKITETPFGLMKQGGDEDNLSPLDQTSASFLRRLSRPEKLIRLIFSTKKEKLESMSQITPEFTRQPLGGSGQYPGELGKVLKYDENGHEVLVKRESELTSPLCTPSEKSESSRGYGGVIAPGVVKDYEVPITKKGEQTFPGYTHD